MKRGNGSIGGEMNLLSAAPPLIELLLLLLLLLLDSVDVLRFIQTVVQSVHPTASSIRKRSIDHRLCLLFIQLSLSSILERVGC